MKPHIAHVDDGSILFEWIAKDRRFGIVIDKDNIKESSWFYVNKDGTNECGDLPEELLSYFITPELTGERSESALSDFVGRFY